jgi:N-acetyl-anhydromuramyl-L-alanine amidase AmpD
MKPTYIIIHTAAFKGDASIEDVDRWHKDRGFKRKGKHALQHVGYQWYIRRDGSVAAGRMENENGAHCLDKGMNSKSIGICFEGHGDFEEFTDAQRESLMKLYWEIHKRWAIPVQNVLGHRETGAKKTCPGNLIDMNELREFLA